MNWCTVYSLADLVKSSLFSIFNTLVRASPESREAVLEYFATVVKLNIKRAGMQVGRVFWTGCCIVLNSF